MTAEMMLVDRGGIDLLLTGSRPLKVHAGTKQVKILTNRGMMVNSLLREDEWQQVDRAVLQAARYPLRAVADLQSRGLTHPLGGLGTLISTWYRQSEMTGATINMSGYAGASRDLPELSQVGVPIPVIFKEFSFDVRALLASRQAGDGLDVTTAIEASRVVAEAVESLLVNGSSARLNGSAIYGYRTHPNRITGSASGDFGTIGNIIPTFSAIISALNAQLHYGPYVVYLSTDQYTQMTTQYYTDGTANTPMDRVRAMPQISDVRMLPPATLPDGEIIAVDMMAEVVDWAEAAGIQTREWMSGDGFISTFKVFTVAAPRVKARYDGKSGLLHYTGA